MLTCAYVHNMFPLQVNYVGIDNLLLIPFLSKKKLKTPLSKNYNIELFGQQTFQGGSFVVQTYKVKKSVIFVSQLIKNFVQERLHLQKDLSSLLMLILQNFICKILVLTNLKSIKVEQDFIIYVSSWELLHYCFIIILLQKRNYVHIFNNFVNAVNHKN